MWDLKVIDVDKSLYIALADALERDIRSGVLRAGDLLPTHRELAKKVGVTVTTVTRAYAEAARRNLINAIVGKGTFVAADAGVSASLINAEHKEEVPPIEMGLVHPLYSEECCLDMVVAEVLKRGDPHKYIVYADPQGMPRHREIGAAWVGRFGIKAEKDSIIITAGTQHALHCIFSSLFESGDRIAVDCLTFPGVKAAARSNGLRLEAVTMDEFGMVPASLEALCNRHEVKGIYATGNIQNPTNCNMNADRRRAISEIIRRRNLLLVEDDVYGFLAARPQPLAALAPQHSIYIAGLSKAFYAGLRVAFVAAPPSLCGRITQGVVDSIWMASPLCAEIACEAITSTIADRIIERKKAELDKRIALFRKKMRGFTFLLGGRNMFAWIKLPEYWTGGLFEQAAQESGIRVVAAEKFTVGHMPPPDFVRVAISAAEDWQTFEAGLDILVEVLKRQPRAAASAV